MARFCVLERQFCPKNHAPKKESRDAEVTHFVEAAEEDEAYVVRQPAVPRGRDLAPRNSFLRVNNTYF